MKAIIMSHERGGSYVLERSGSFRFVNGYTSRLIGTEIELKPQVLVSYRRITAMAACFVILK